MHHGFFPVRVVVQTAEGGVVRVHLDEGVGHVEVGQGEIPDEMVGNLQPFLDDQGAQERRHDVDAHAVQAPVLVVGGDRLVFVVEGFVGDFHLSDVVGLSVDFDEREDFHAPVHGEMHPLEEAHVEDDFARKLVIEGQKKVHQAQHLFFLAFGELAFEGDEKRVQEEALDPAVELPVFQPGVKGLGKLVVQDLDRIDEPVQLIAGEGADIGVQQGDGLGAQGQGDPEGKEHVAALTPHVSANPAWDS